VEHGAVVDKFDLSGHTPLHLAAASADISAIQCVLLCEHDGTPQISPMKIMGLIIIWTG
jgi:ankyrin repeat protein